MRNAKAKQWRLDDDLFARVGEFLSANALPTEPSYYAFAYRVVSSPDSDLAKTVAR